MKRNVDMDDPFFKFTHEEKMQMTDDEFFDLLEEHNEYVDKKYSTLNEEQESYPKFNSIEECMKYYDAIPLDEFINNCHKLFDSNDNNQQRGYKHNI